MLLDIHQTHPAIRAIAGHWHLDGFVHMFGPWSLGWFMSFTTPGLLLFGFRDTFLSPKRGGLALACLKCLDHLLFQHFNACAQQPVVLLQPPILRYQPVVSRGTS